jgi:DamX protein
MNDSAIPAQPEYLRAWSLRRHPFAEGVDAQFFYAGSALIQRLDLLTHLVQFSESIVVVSGPPGSGKTTLLEQFLGHINPQWIVCRIDGAQGDKLAERMAETIGVNPGEDEQTLLSRWVAQSDPAQQMIIVLDNAGQLDEAACRRLCELTNLADGDRLRVVLFGTADTSERVRAMLEQLSSKRTCQTLELPKLTEEETAAYLMYRLAVAGYSGESPFTPTEVRAICKSADGRPGRINRLAHESLVEHHMRAKIKKRAPVQRSPKKNTTPLWIGASVVIVVLAGYFGWQRLAPTQAPDHSSTTPEQAAVEQPLILPADVIDNGIPIQAEPARPVEQRAETESRDIRVAVSDKPAVTLSGTTEPAEPVAVTEADTPHPAEAVKPDTRLLAASKERAAAEVVTGTAAGDSAMRSDIPLQPAAPPASGQPTTADQAKSVVATSPAQQPAASTEAPSHRESWLLQQPPGAFTLQLLGSRNPSSIVNYIRRNALDPEKTAWYRGRYRDDDWYVLLYGIYPDKTAALEARSALPIKVQKAKPWPRSLKSVHNSINEVR